MQIKNISENYKNLEALKLKWLQARAAKVEEQFRKGELVDGEIVFKELLS